MKRTPVTSSNLVSVGHNAKTSTLEVEFKSGAIWQYANVDEALFNQLITARRPGKFFFQEIKSCVSTPGTKIKDRKPAEDAVQKEPSPLAIRLNKLADKLGVSISGLAKDEDALEENNINPKHITQAIISEAKMLDHKDMEMVKARVDKMNKKVKEQEEEVVFHHTEKKGKKTPKAEDTEKGEKEVKAEPKMSFLDALQAIADKKKTPEEVHAMFESQLKSGSRKSNGGGGDNGAKAFQKGGKAAIFGYSATAVIRWMGLHDWKFDACRQALNNLGANCISDTTVKIQLAAGRKGERGEPAPLTKEQIKEVTNAASA